MIDVAMAPSHRAKRETGGNQQATQKATLKNRKNNLKKVTKCNAEHNCVYEKFD